MDSTTTRPDQEPRPLRADARRNRARLLDEARVAFGERGTEASLDEIARRAGVGIGTLYRHFPTRDDLVESLISGEVQRLGTLSASLAEADDPFDALRTWLQALVRHACAFRGLAESLVTAAGGEGRLAMACHDTESAGQVLFERAQRSGHVRPDASTQDVVDLACSIAWITERSERDLGEGDRLLDLALDGLRAQQ